VAVAVLTAIAVVLAPRAARAAPPKKRAAQHYGRPAPKQPASHALDAPLRIVLFPAWLVFEVVLRQPHAALVSAVEGSDTVRKAQDKTSDGPLKELTILPAARFDVGMKSLVGLNGRWRYHRNDLMVQAGTWGVGTVQAHASDRFEFRPRQFLGALTAFERREDLPFYGLGPRSRDEDRSRYAATALRLQVAHAVEPWRASSVASTLGVRGQWNGETELAAPGMGQRYAAAYQRVELTFDSRRQVPTRSVSVRASVYEEATFAVAGARQSWLRYGGALGATVDLTGTRRLLSLGLQTDLVDPLQGIVPLTDLVTLGGDRLLHGYLRGRLVDRSAMVAIAEYTWPTWVFLDGVLHAAVGNVFGPRFSGAEAGALRYSAGVGLRSTGDRRSRFELLFAVGSRPFDEGGRIDSVRFLVGTQHGP